MWSFISVFAVVYLLFVDRLPQALANGDKLKRFYRRIQKSDVKYCKDRTKLLPQCEECIPGLQKGPGSDSCNEYLPSSKAIRDEIKNITLERFGSQHASNQPFGLYPYLEQDEFVKRQTIYGKMLSSPAAKASTVIDIGAYYNPIHLFLSHEVCLKHVIVVEPILDALSVQVPCASNRRKKTHVMFLPVTFKHYMTVAAALPQPDSVVCVGCDSHYGPNRNMLETAFRRPYKLYLEFAPAYITNAPFLSMNGTGAGEKLLYSHSIYVNSNETEFKERSMKVIQYTPI